MNMFLEYNEQNRILNKPVILSFIKDGGIYINPKGWDKSKASFPNNIFIRRNSNPKIKTEKVLNYKWCYETRHLSKLEHIGKWKALRFYQGDRFYDEERSYFIMIHRPDEIIIKVYPLWMPKNNQHKAEIQAFIQPYLYGMKSNLIMAFLNGLSYD